MKKTALLLMALTLPALAQGAGDAEAGKAVFTRLCSGCHKIGPSARSAFGPPSTASLVVRRGNRKATCTPTR